MKKIISLLILSSLLLSGCSYRVFREAEPFPAEVDSTSAPAATPATPEPEPGLSEEEARNRVLVGYMDQQQSYPSEDGTGSLLEFACRTPHVSLPGLDEQESSINAVLLSLTEEFINGSQVEGDIVVGVEELLQEAAEHRREMGSENWLPYARDREIYVARGDAAVLSFVYDGYTNRGGAHGITTRSGVNFDVEGGRELLFADLAADEEALRALCLQSMIEQARSLKDSRGLFDDYESTLPLLIRDGNWYFSQSGLVIVANPYDIAPYVAGRIEFSISYKTLSGVIHERWQRPVKEIVQGGIDGSMASEQALGSSESLADLKLTTQGDEVILWANNSVYDVRINRVMYQEESGEFAADTELFYASRMDDGEFLRLLLNLPEGLPNTSVSWRLPEGTLQRLLLSQSGEDGSLLLLDPASLDTIPPVKLLPGESVWRDLNRDALGESIELRADGNGCELTVAFNGTLLSKSFDYTTDQLLWIANADGNSDTELLICGKKADGSYETRVFRLAGELVPVAFLDGDEEKESLPLRLVSAENGFFTLEGRVDILGTYEGVCRYTAGPQGGLTPDPDSGWELQNNDSWLKTAKDMNVVLPDGGTGRLSSGTEIRLLCITMDHVLYETRDGSQGRIAIDYDGDAKEYLVAGTPESNAFMGLPYKK